MPRGVYNAAVKMGLDLQPARIVGREEWLAERKALLEKEKELSRRRDALAAERRALPWVLVEKGYRFEAPEGTLGLSELFDGRSQLAVYHFMLGPDSERPCVGCSFLCDHVDAARRHFEQADLSFVAVSRAPLARIEAVKRRMGWRFRWVSSAGSDFNYDFGASFTPAQVEAGAESDEKLYNYGSGKAWHDLHGTSVFARDGEGRVCHTYSCYARGDEAFAGAFHWLDLAPLGRNESSTMSWVRLHDEYEAAPEARRHGEAAAAR